MKLGANWIIDPVLAVICLVVMFVSAAVVYFAAQYGTYFPLPAEPINYRWLMLNYGNARLIAALVGFGVLIIVGVLFNLRAVDNPVLGWGIAAVPMVIAMIALLSLWSVPSGDRLTTLDTLTHDGKTYHLTYAVSLSSVLPPSPATYFFTCEGSDCSGRIIPLTSDAAQLDLNDGTVRVLDGETVRFDTGNDSFAVDTLIGDTQAIDSANISDLSLLAQMPLGYGYDIAYANNGSLAMTTLNGGMWQITRREILGYQPLPNSNQVSYIEYNADDSLLVAQHIFSDVTVWDAQTGDIIQTAAIEQTNIDAKHFALHPMDDTIATIGEDNKKVVLSNTTDFEQFAETATTLPIISLDYTPDGTKIAMQVLLRGEYGELRQIILLDSETGERLSDVRDLPYRVPMVALSNDSTHLAYLTERWAVNQYEHSTFVIWDFETDETIEATFDERFTDFAFSADDAYLFALSGTELQVFDTATLDLLHAIEVDSQQATTLAVSADGQTIAISGFDGMLRFYGVE